jgi:hypothetical protein
MLSDPKSSTNRSHIVSQLIESIYSESQFGMPVELESAGTSLENPYAYDSAAREIRAMADQGLVKILHEQMRQGSQEPLIRSISFARLR